MNTGTTPEATGMLLIRQMKNRYIPFIVSLSIAMMLPASVSAFTIPNGAYTEVTQENRYINSSYDQTLLEKREKQMIQHIAKMDKQLRKYPGDAKLKARREKALVYCEKARKYFEYAMESPDISDNIPTAGVSALTTEYNSTSYWMNEFNQIVRECLSLNTKADYFYGFYNLSSDRKAVVKAAISLEGKIPYVWGGKPQEKGWNELWDDKLHGLDCSGFVTWAYWTGLDQNMADERLASTLAISRNVTKIDRSELMPGDLGMIIDDGTYYTDVNGNHFYSPEAAVSSNETIKADLEQKDIQKQLKAAKKKAKKAKKDFDEDKFIKSATADVDLDVNNVKTHSNHVGIYVGKDKDGNDLWCHCTGGSIRTVVVNNYDRFQYFYRVLEDEEE